MKDAESYTAEEKMGILRSHLLDRISVSEICQKHGLQPEDIYRWREEFFENAAAIFQNDTEAQERKDQERIDFLESKLRRKEEVLTELKEALATLKKTLGES
ncbi:MAG: transposase [Candidatus Hydrogenedens sp.]|jgi:transposase-like protein|nr:transposase [Candidatus Hydrogenedens sp.]